MSIIITYRTHTYSLRASSHYLRTEIRVVLRRGCGVSTTGPTENGISHVMGQNCSLMDDVRAPQMIQNVKKMAGLEISESGPQNHQSIVTIEVSGALRFGVLARPRPRRILSRLTIYKMSSTVSAPAAAANTVSIIEGRPVLYANVVLQSASEAIKEGVSTKIQELKRLAPPLKQRLAKHVSRIAADKVSAKVVVDRLVPKLVADIPVKMKKKGLTVHVEEVFRDGPYFVLMLQVQHVDATGAASPHLRSQ